MDTSLCQQAKEINSEPTFLMVHAIVALLDFTSVISILYVNLMLLRSKVFHFNLQLLLTNLSLAIIVRNSFTFGRSMNTLVMAAVYKDPCDLLYKGMLCQLISAFGVALIETSVFAQVIIAIERTIATIWYKKYEKFAFPFFPVFLAAVSWWTVFVFIYNVATANFGPSAAPYRAYCNSQTSKSFNWEKLIHLKVPIVVLTLIVIISVAVASGWLTRRERCLQNHLNLSARFQLRENLKATNVIIPNSVAHLILILLNICALVPLRYGTIEDWKSSATYKEATSLTMPIYGNVYALMFVLYCRPVREATLRMLACGRVYPSSPGKIANCEKPAHSEGKKYFSALQEQWKLSAR